MEKLLFLTFAGIAIGAALNLLLSRRPIYSALSLIGVMGALAVLYLLLGAEFIAAVQVIVYAGAIMVLFVFVIMLLNAGEEVRTNRSLLARFLGLPLVLLALLFLVQFARMLHREYPQTVSFGTFVGSTKDIGRLLFDKYLLAFEVTSVLILVAIMGAVVLAQRKQYPRE
jgi:NADH-quinone oxidoreductase subunit J